MRVLLSGKISLLFYGASYAVMSLLLVRNREDAYRVKIAHGQMYIDCDVDGDDNKNTCVTDFTVEKVYIFNTAYVLGASLAVSAVCMILQSFLHRRRCMTCKLYYVDAVVATTLFTLAIAVVAGLQELSTLVLLLLNTLMYHLGCYVHDHEFWGSSVMEYKNSMWFFIVLTVINAVTLSVILLNLLLSHVVSYVHTFVSFMTIVWIAHFFIVVYVGFRNKYSTVPSIVERSARLNKQKTMVSIGRAPPMSTVFEVVKDNEPNVLDFFHSIRYFVDFSMKLTIAVAFYLSTENLIITFDV